jgi:hypothetical protein
MSHSAKAAVDLSAERQEHRYLLPPGQAQAFARALNRHLQHHRHKGVDANTLPRPRHFVTTVYFDTPSRHAFHALRSGHPADQQVKLRAREYYDLHPSLAELATQRQDFVRHSPGVWLELKFRDGNRTGKRRLPIPRPYVPEVIASLTNDPAARARSSPAPAVVSQDFESDALTPAPAPIWDENILREIRTFCARYPERLRADCLVHYRRLPWQDDEAELRVTLDVGVEFFAPPKDLWGSHQALVRDGLGSPKRRFERAIIELKCRTAPPGWLIDLLGGLGAEPSRVSKFEEAAQAVHGVAD